VRKFDIGLNKGTKFLYADFYVIFFFVKFLKNKSEKEEKKTQRIDFDEKKYLMKLAYELWRCCQRSSESQKIFSLILRNWQ